jgi:hypothetical protein
MDRVGLRLADDSGLGWSRSPSIAIEARVPAKPLSRALPKVVCMCSLLVRSRQNRKKVPISGVKQGVKRLERERASVPLGEPKGTDSPL